MTNVNTAGRVVLAVALASLAACRAPTAGDGAPVTIGAWGGDHVRVDIAPGDATVEYDCAHGTIDQPLVPDRTGSFSAVGTHTFEHGGPIRSGELPDRHPARYDGQVSGETLRFSVTITDRPQTLGAFTVTRGAGARLVKCL